jgi:protein-disulfide isomerase
MKAAYLICAVAALVPLAACNKGKESTAKDTSAAAYKPVPPPADGDWSQIVTPTPAGGFMMGNPVAKVHLIEYGALTCPHCRAFDETGVTPLIDTYVKTGKVSYEFRNYLLSAMDLAPSLIARCNGAKSFFALTRALYKDQADWVDKVQATPKDQLEGLQTLPTEQVPPTVARFAGLPEWAAMRGVPEAKSAQCLSNKAEVDRLVQMTQDATDQYPDFPGTPTFIINGKMVELGRVTEAEVWPGLERKLKEAL